MAKVRVEYQSFTMGDFEAVALIDPKEYAEDGSDYDESILELAFMLTQNLKGSWSIGPNYEDGEVNEDFDPRIERLVDLHEYNGRKLGLRSSMMGDRFVIVREDGTEKSFICDFIGFKEEK